MNKQKLLYPIPKSSSRNNHHLLEFKNQFLTPNKKSQPLHQLSQIKPKINVIKINKAKLPPDFFPKCFSFQKKLPNFKLNINQHQRLYQKQPNYKPRRVQSQRLHNSPEKTSFFGFFQQEPYPPKHPESKTLALKRKFETRDEPKRDNSQMKRRFTPGSNIHRNQILDLFPATYDQQMTQIITSNSSARINKISPRKQYHSKYQQLVYDPQKQDNDSFIKSDSLIKNDSYTKNELLIKNYDLGQNNSGNSNNTKQLINLKTIQKRQEDKIKDQVTFISSQTVDLHNMTFFNAKSSCLPPIKKV